MLLTKLGSVCREIAISTMRAYNSVTTLLLGVVGYYTIKFAYMIAIATVAPTTRLCMMSRFSEEPKKKV